MKYIGVNREGFERDARLFCEHYRDRIESGECGTMDDDFTRDALSLAADYSVPETDIWDYLAEFGAVSA
jgi:hypothetical protein